MNTRVDRGRELKEERKVLLREVEADHGPDWVEQYKPGTMGCHELLDRTSTAADTVERFVLSHPACIQNEEWFALARAAAAALHELYQRVGEAHLGEGT